MKETCNTAVLEEQEVLLTDDLFTKDDSAYTDADKMTRPSLSYWSDAWRRFKENKLAMISAAILLVIILMAIFQPMFSPYAYDQTDYFALNQGPSMEHLFGTDELGRDIFTRCWMGARVSLSIALVVALLSGTLGILYGGVAGYFGGWADNIMMRFCELIASIPQMLWVVLLILVIQGSVWLNFSFPTLQNSPVYFLSYLIVSSIQMGANIDYAIVISSRYQELKNKMPRREAMIETLNLSFPTVFTSGTIMASAGIFISKMTTDPAIYAVGLCIGRGTIISMLLVMGILPGILLLGDTIIDRTTFNIKYPAIVQTTEAVGMVRLDGRIRGTVSGKIDAEVHGVLMGDVSAVISAGNPDAVKAIGELPDGEDPGSLEEKPDENEKNTEKGENDHEA